MEQYCIASKVSPIGTIAPSQEATNFTLLYKGPNLSDAEHTYGTFQFAIEYVGNEEDSLFYLLGVRELAEYVSCYVEVLDKYLGSGSGEEKRPLSKLRDLRTLKSFRRKLKARQDPAFSLIYRHRLSDLEEFCRGLTVSNLDDLYLLIAVLSPHKKACRRALDKGDADLLQDVLSDMPQYMTTDLRHYGLYAKAYQKITGRLVFDQQVHEVTVWQEPGQIRMVHTRNALAVDAQVTLLYTGVQPALEGVADAHT